MSQKSRKQPTGASITVYKYPMATGIIKKYLRHFVDNVDSRWVLLQGGRRSGKSFAIYKWLHILLSGQPKVCGIITASFPALQLAMNDFQRATGLVVTGSALYGYSTTLSNGSRFVFKSYDDPTKAQGSTYDLVYLEEVLNIDEQVVSVLSMSVTGQKYASFNPTRTGWISKYIDEKNLLCTTFKDNPYLTESQIGEFESIKERAMRPTASLLDIYNYTVYYKGEFGTMSGKVFKLIYTISDDEWEKIPSPVMYGLDFGFTESEQSDKTALAAVKIYNNCLYTKEFIYSNQLANDKALAFELNSLGLDVYSPIVADYAGLGGTRIKTLITADNGSWTETGISYGFSIQNAKKGKIFEGLQKMNQFDKIFVTESSENLRYEFDNYELNAEGKPKKCPDHLIDAVRYAVNSWNLNFY